MGRERRQTKHDPHSGSFANRGRVGDGVSTSALHALQRRIGNQAVQQALHPRIQTKLRVSEPGDSAEREADRVSDQVMRMPEPTLQRACSCGGSCPSCRSAPDESLQRSPAPAAEPAAAGVPPSVHDVLSSPGQPLDSSTRAFMEPRFGYDFSRVRVHTGGLAERSAHELNAHAYTVGRDIVFGAGRLSPGTDDGRRLLAHELTHVVQQGEASSVVQRQPADSDPEREAAVAEAEAILSVTTEQLEEQADAEVRLRLDDRRKREKRYGQLLAMKDKARIKKKQRISAEHQQEMGVKLRFLQREAKAAYLMTLRDVLSEYPEEALQIMGPPPPPGTGASEEQAHYLGCDPGQHEYALEYEEEPERARCMNIRSDPEFLGNLADRNIASVVGYAVNDTTWENVQYDSFKVMVVKYKNGNVDYFMLDDVADFHYSSNANIIREFVYVKRKTGYLYPVRGGQIYTNEVLTPNLMAYKNGLKYQVKDLQALFELLTVAGTFAAIMSSYGIVEGFRQSVKPFGHGKGGGRRRVPRSPRRPAPASEPENTSTTAPKQVAHEAPGESAVVSRIFEQMGGTKLGYTVKTCNDATVIETPTTRHNVGLTAKYQGGAFTDTSTKTVWIHESVLTEGGIHRRWGRLTVSQVVAHELGHVRGGGFDCAKSSRIGAELPGLSATERQGLIDDALNIEKHLRK